MNRQASVAMAGNVGFRLVRARRNSSFWQKMWEGVFGDRSVAEVPRLSGQYSIDSTLHNVKFTFPLLATIREVRGPWLGGP